MSSTSDGQGVTRKPPVPVIVATGQLSQREFDSVSPEMQQMLEAETSRMLDQYGQAWLDKHRDRLRGELEFCYAVDLDE